MGDTRQEKIRRIMDNAVLPGGVGSVIPKFMFDQVSLAMGASAEFDYALDDPIFAARITRCYELAGKAFLHGWDRVSVLGRPNLPKPALLIHGQWSSPETRDEPIDHAWVMLSDERIWEPITMALCDPDMFYEYTEGTQDQMYGKAEAAIKMLHHGHYGPWPDESLP